MKNLFLLLAIFASISLSAKNTNELKFKKGKFKIVQITDAHYRTNSEESKKTLEIIKNVIALEKPDLFVLSGDIVTSDKAKESWEEILAPIIASKIPYALAFGNHDDEGSMSREEIFNFITSQPYNVNKENPKNVVGWSNFALEIKGQSGKTESVCWIFDSHSYSQNKLVEGYDWVKPSQVEWYSNLSKKFTKENNGIPLPSVSFLHIPLPEYTTAFDRKEGRNVGTRSEVECSPKMNSGLFLEMMQRGDIMSVFAGHDHDSDYVSKYRNILLGYGRFSGSKVTYTSLGSGARVFELTEGERALKTWVMSSNKVLQDTVNYPIDYEKGGKLHRAPHLDSVSYALGAKIGNILSDDNINLDNINLELLLQAIKDVPMGKNKYSKKEIDAILTKYIKHVKNYKEE